MGYPMTWRRYINRNSLQDGDYGTAPTHRRLCCNMDPDSWSAGAPERKEGMTEKEVHDEFYKSLGPHYREELLRYDGFMKMMVGDLRRLERDVVDEGSVCFIIERTTGIDHDTVAAVLKAFMEL